MIIRIFIYVLHILTCDVLNVKRIVALCCLVSCFLIGKGIIWPAPLLVSTRQTSSETAWNQPSTALIFWHRHNVLSYTAGIRELGVARQVDARCQTFAINRQDSPARRV